MNKMKDRLSNFEYMMCRLSATNLSRDQLQIVRCAKESIRATIQELYRNLPKIPIRHQPTKNQEITELSENQTEPSDGKDLSKFPKHDVCNGRCSKESKKRGRDEWQTYQACRQRLRPQCSSPSVCSRGESSNSTLHYTMQDKELDSIDQASSQHNKERKSKKELFHKFPSSSSTCGKTVSSESSRSQFSRTTSSERSQNSFTRNSAGCKSIMPLNVLTEHDPDGVWFRETIQATCPSESSNRINDVSFLQILGNTLGTKSKRTRFR